MPFILYYSSPNPEVDSLKSVIAANASEAEVAFATAKPGRHGSHAIPRLLEVNGSIDISGGNAIVRHFVADGSADTWFDSEAAFIASSAAWTQSVAKLGSWSEEAIAESKQKALAFFASIDAAIGLEGSRVIGAADGLSAVDIVLWSTVFPYVGTDPLITLPGFDLSGYANLIRWFNLVASSTQVANAIQRLHPLTAYHTSPYLVDSPRLPVTHRRNILVTSALPYVNNEPHLGNIVGCVLSADVFSRHAKARGHNVIYICGTDEYGTATETKALAEKKTPRQICDEFHLVHAGIYKWFGIGFDQFGRTSTDHQTQITQAIFLRLREKGFVTTDTMEQLFCAGCDRFLADRFVEGTCPNCKYEDARGDQCDKCQKLLNTTELINPRCKLCSQPPHVRSTEHLFIDLPKIKDRLSEWVDSASVKGDWDTNAISIAQSWVKGGKGEEGDKLRPRCITRDLKWGVPVPLEGFTGKVFYVWFDAPIGYISITAAYTDEWKRWWNNPENVQLYQFMGKDNVAFHTIIFPASLLGTCDPWTTLHHISSTEYLNYQGGKFSKSRNTGVFGSDAAAADIPAAVWRYCLIANRPESSDTNFTWEDLAAKNNSELLNNLGNFIHRILQFCSATFDSVVPPISPNDDDLKFFEKVSEAVAKYNSKMDASALREGIYAFMDIAHLGNSYFQDMKPWEVKKSDMGRCGSIVGVAVNVVYLLAACAQPFMPSVTEKISEFLRLDAYDIPDAFELRVPSGHTIGVSEPLFTKIDDEKIKKLRIKFSGEGAPKFPLDLRIGEIVSVEVLPSEPKPLYYNFQVDVGEAAPRNIVSRLAEYYPVDAAESLKGKYVVVLCNLPTAELQGRPSEGMILCGEKGRSTGFLHPSAPVKAGARILAEEAELKPAEAISLAEFKKFDFKLRGANGWATFLTHPLYVEGALPEEGAAAAAAAVASAIVRIVGDREKLKVVDGAKIK